MHKHRLKDNNYCSSLHVLKHVEHSYKFIIKQIEAFALLLDFDDQQYY